MTMLLNPFVFGGGGGGGGGGEIPFSSVVLLMGFEGTDGSTSFVDESSYAKTPTVFGNAQMTTTTPLMGTSSYLSDGNGDEIRFDDSDDWDFGTGAFTVEAFTRNTNFGNYRPIVGQWDSTASARNWLFMHFDTTGRLHFRARISGADVTLEESSSPSINTTYHACVERDATGKLRIYRDGVMVASHATDFAGAFQTSGTALRVGATSFNASNRFMIGRMDELRITKGYARYASDSGFTPPTEAFPRS